MHSESVNPRPSHMLPLKGKGLLAEPLPGLKPSLSSKLLVEISYSHLFNKYLINAYYVVSTLLATGDIKKIHAGTGVGAVTQVIQFGDSFLAGAVHKPQGMSFHRQSKLAFKSKASGFKFKMAG